MAGAVDSVEQLFLKAANDLSYVQHKLETEFENKFASNENPFKLISRIKRIQEELPLIQKDCHDLLSAKQELIDKTKKILMRNRALIHQMQLRAGIPIINDQDDPVYTNFMKILQEWNCQHNLQPNDENGFMDSKDLNQKLFSIFSETY